MSYKDVAKNRFKVRRKNWESWTPVARHVFNKTFEYMMKNPDVMQNPRVTQADPRQYKTICWNSAWMAADICSRGERHLYEEIF